MKRVNFPYEVRNGSVSIKIYRTPTRGCDSYTLSYWQDGTRKRPTFSEFAVAKAEAETVARRLSSTESAVLQLTSADRSAYLRAAELLKPLGVPIEVAAAQFAEAKQIIGDTDLSKAAEFYARHHSKTIQIRHVQALIEEMLTSKRQDGLSNGYLCHLRYDLEKFANAINYNIAEISGVDVDAWLRSLGVAARTRNNIRTSIQTLFNFAKFKECLPKDHDQIKVVPLAKTPRACYQL